MSRRKRGSKITSCNDEVQGDESPFVLVGTYRSACHDWLMSGHGAEGRSYYNLPFHGTAAEAKRYAKFNMVFLFSKDYSPILRRARYVGVVSAKKLQSSFGYPSRDNPHSDRYALFEMAETITLRQVRQIERMGSSRYVICVDQVADSRYKWIDVLSFYVSSSKIAFDGWALTNKIPKWICKAASNLPRRKECVYSQTDFFAGLCLEDPKEHDVWSNAVPVEKSSYLQDEGVLFLNKSNVKIERDKLKMLDLFCGAGGFAVGAEWSGFQSVFGVDHLEPAIRTWMHNHPHALGCLADIRKVDPVAVRDMLAEKGVDHIDLITGGVPCQGFSRANRKHTDTDERNFLFLEYMRFVRTFDPPYIILENVSGMRSTAGGHFESEIKHYMEGLGYTVSVKLVNAASYGVPQIRQRLLFIGVKHGVGLTEPYEFPPVQFDEGHFRTVGDAISDLPPLGNDETKVRYEVDPQNEYQVLMRKTHVDAKTGQLYNHAAPNHPQETIERIGNTVPGEPMYPMFQQRIRLRMDRPSPTQLAGGIRPQFQFGHPLQPRGLSIRERARIQSFPDDYEFMGGTVQERVQTGNAVPPLLVRSITQPIARDLKRRG